MKRLMRLAALPLVLLLLAPASQAADAKRGEQLHNSQCISCHATRFGNNGNDIYTRANRRVTSLAGLKKQVTRCRDNLSVTWFDEDVDDVVAYLNAHFYKFKE
ncbi:MAG TPA: cytochrome c [Gammaproteobacteria bacterium]